MKHVTTGKVYTQEEREAMTISNEKQWRCPNCQGVHPIKDAREY